LAKKSIEEELAAMPQGDSAGTGDHVDLVEEVDNGSISLFVLSPRIRTVQEAIAKAEIDTEIWEASQVHIKSWEVGSKVETTNAKGRKITRGMAVCPLFGVHVTLKRKKCWNPQEFKRLLLDDMRSQAPHYQPVKRDFGRSAEPLLAEISVPDHHFGKLAWEPESGDNYDLKIADRRYRNAIDDLVNAVLPYYPEKFLYVVGNDLLHVDSGKNATTAGTPQDVDGRWQKSYRWARQAVTDSIELMRQYAPVQVLIVAGNHDEEKLFCLGDAIECRFDGDPEVMVDNAPCAKKAYQYGNCMLGFHHGNKIKAEKIATEFQASFPEIYAATTWREVHCGHYHSEKEMVFLRSMTASDIIVRYLPSLSGTDKWHAEHAYRGPKAAEAHLFHKQTGRLAYFTCHPRDDP